MEDKQCKQMELFSVMAKGSDYFLSLDDKFKQRYKAKINNIQWYDPYQIKKKNFQAILVNFHQCSHIPSLLPSQLLFIFIKSTD